MTKTTLNVAGRAAAAELQSLAAQGVKRAMASRMTELTAQQVQAVGGAASLALASFDGDFTCGTGVRPFPKFTGIGGVGGGVIVIINGQYPNLNQAALGAVALGR